MSAPFAANSLLKMSKLQGTRFPAGPAALHYVVVPLATSRAVAREVFPTRIEGTVADLLPMLAEQGLARPERRLSPGHRLLMRRWPDWKRSDRGRRTWRAAASQTE